MIDTAPLAAPDNADFDGAIADVEKQLGTLLIRARNSIRTHAVAIHPALQPQGFMVLTTLSRTGPRQQGWLAHELGSDKAMMSRTIKQLESLNFVTRTIDPSDGRAQLVSMTPEAHSRYDANLAQVRQVLHDRLSEWDIDEVHRFAGLLAKIASLS
ncbi:MarR family winged helix-turn-helix transcriptional regulator [Pseudarthrobacter sulfonivorans]|uniref:MarR family winged helix-turn-helix transcriptional regulator n=1 Tax=Pseudarthrobacter sulfonivorans TaxID=121292 RepID=UPI0021073851|nr:MarR family transcriptional regulator [Pseudarthrobacter sulfonivorans]